MFRFGNGYIAVLLKKQSEVTGDLAEITYRRDARREMGRRHDRDRRMHLSPRAAVDSSPPARRRPRASA